MGWKTIDVLCKDCEHKWDILIDSSEEENAFVCVECGGVAHKTISAPMILRASHQAGYNKGPAYQDIKQAARLKKERANLPHGAAREPINREIAAREKSAGKSYVKKEKGQ